MSFSIFLNDYEQEDHREDKMSLAEELLDGLLTDDSVDVNSDVKLVTYKLFKLAEEKDEEVKALKLPKAKYYLLGEERAIGVDNIEELEDALEKWGIYQ